MAKPAASATELQPTKKLAELPLTLLSFDQIKKIFATFGKLRKDDQGNQYWECDLPRATGFSSRKILLKGTDMICEEKEQQSECATIRQLNASLGIALTEMKNGNEGYDAGSDLGLRIMMFMHLESVVFKGSGKKLEEFFSHEARHELEC